MTRLIRMLLAADGGAGGGALQEPANAGQPKGPAKPEAPVQPTELETLKAENEALRKEKADKVKTDEDAKLAAMSETERRKAEEKKLHDQLVEDNRKMQLQKAGLDDEYADLVSGDTADEISRKGSLVAKLIAKVKAETEAALKKGLARTPVPGEGAGNDEKTDAKAFFESIMKGGR